jgi:hypothetical protein
MANEARHFHRAKAKKEEPFQKPPTLFSVQVSTYPIRQVQTSPFFLSTGEEGSEKN